MTLCHERNTLSSVSGSRSANDSSITSLSIHPQHLERVDAAGIRMALKYPKSRTLKSGLFWWLTNSDQCSIHPNGWRPIFHVSGDYHVAERCIAGFESSCSY